MIEYFIQFLKQNSWIPSYIALILVIVLSIVVLIFKENIKTYFQKRIIETQESYKRDLEAYKTSLIQQLEEYKLDIDIRRSMHIEMSHQRLLAYQKTISSFAHLYTLLLRYNKSPSIEQKNAIFSQNELRGCEDLIILEDNIFFFSQKISEQAKIFAEKINPIIDLLDHGQPIQSAKLNEYSELFKNLKRAMVSEILPENIKRNETNE